MEERERQHAREKEREGEMRGGGKGGWELVGNQHSIFCTCPLPTAEVMVMHPVSSDDTLTRTSTNLLSCWNALVLAPLPKPDAFVLDNVPVYQDSVYPASMCLCLSLRLPWVCTYRFSSDTLVPFQHSR